MSVLRAFAAEDYATFAVRSGWPQEMGHHLSVATRDDRKHADVQIGMKFNDTVRHPLHVASCRLLRFS